MRLNERPFTQQVSYGEDPIKNTVLGLDANYQTEVPALTRALDKLPIYSTTSPSFLNSNVEVAALLPGHPKQIDALDPEGAIYIDKGYAKTREVILTLMARSIEEASIRGAGLDGKTALQEIVAASGWGVPEYRVSESGPDHDKDFIAVAVVNEISYGEGHGKSKREAEQVAARLAYEAIVKSQQNDA